MNDMQCDLPRCRFFFSLGVDESTERVVSVSMLDCPSVKPVLRLVLLKHMNAHIFLLDGTVDEQNLLLREFTVF